MSPWSGPVLGHGAPTSLPSAPTCRKGLVADLSLSMGSWGAGGSAAGLGISGLSLQQQLLPHRQGWKRNLTSSPQWGTDRRLYRFGSIPCSESKLDAEMAMFKLEITCTVSDNLSSLISQSQASPSPTTNSGSSPVATASSLEKRPSLGFLKRKRSGYLETHDNVQGDCGWVPPSKLVVRKGLTLTDVGELGRIIIPKKDAESLPFPQIDTKEGAVLEMEDYCALKRWHFRFKSSLTRVGLRCLLVLLSCPGSKYICRNILKPLHAILDKDLSSNILDQVIYGQKKTRDDNSLDDSKDSAPETPSSSATESSRITNIDSMPALSG